MWTPLATSAEVMDLTLRSGDDLDSLTRNEKARVRFHMMLFMRTYENAYFHYKIGILKLQDWVAVLGDLEGNLSRPSSPAIWALVRSRTGAEFAAVVDDIIARQDQEAMATS